MVWLMLGLSLMCLSLLSFLIAPLFVLNALTGGAMTAFVTDAAEVIQAEVQAKARLKAVDALARQRRAAEQPQTTKEVQ